MAQNDLIHRGKALKDLRAIKDMLVAAGDPFLASVMNRAIGCIENQPAAEARRMTAEDYREGFRATLGTARCPACMIDPENQWDVSVSGKINYCPNCGHFTGRLRHGKE